MTEIAPIAIPSVILLGMIGWGLKEYIAHLRRRDADHTSKAESQARQMDSIVQSLTRITDVLTGYNGHGGLLTRFDVVQASTESLAERTGQLERKVAILEMRHQS